MKMENLVVGTFQVNCFVIWGETKKAIVIDPGDEPEQIAMFLKTKALSVAAYMLTHGHMDHISALGSLYKIFPAPVGMHAADAAWAFSEANQMPPHYGVPEAPPAIERSLADGQSWNDGDLDYTVLATPGHTPGGLCFFFHEANALITGDTLFAGSAGRTDLPGGNSHLLTASLNRLRSLDNAVRVFPGHGPASTIKREKRINPFMQ